MNTLITFIEAHWAGIVIVSGYFFLAFVSALPEPGDPRPVKEKAYDTFYTFLHIIANKVVERRPGLAVSVTPPTTTVKLEGK